MVSLLQAAREADEFFMGIDRVHDALRRIAATLSSENIPFAVAGAMALNAHGYRRVTEDVDIIITREGLEAFKAKWVGRGWVEKFPGSKGLRDTISNVGIDVLLTGDYPGDGNPKPIRFPDPSGEIAQKDDHGIPYVTLPRLLELKLASGMSAPHRLKDLADAIELVRVNRLPRDYAQKLDAYVRPKFDELWQAAQVREDY